jgi:hypothetical protein
MRTLKAIWGSWKVRAGTVLAALLGLGSGLVFINDAYDSASSIWQKFEHFWSYAATPWIGVFALVAVIILVALGVKDVSAAQERCDGLREQLEEEAERLRTELKAEKESLKVGLEAALALPNLIAVHLFKSNRLEKVLSLSANLNAVNSKLSVDLAKWLGEDSFAVPLREARHAGMILHDVVSLVQMLRLMWGVDVGEISIPLWNPDCRPLHPPGSMNEPGPSEFDPEKNRLFQEGLKRFVGDAVEIANKVGEYCKGESAEIATLRAEIEKRGKEHG